MKDCSANLKNIKYTAVEKIKNYLLVNLIVIYKK